MDSSTVPRRVSELDNVDDGEDWEMVSRDEAPRTNVYWDFQLKTRLGRLYFVVQSTTRNEASTTDEVQNGLDGDHPIHSQEQSRLSKLPAEIRVYIYELVLRIPTNNHGVSLIRTPAHAHRAPSVLALLLTCQRILAEAEIIFYSLNRLSVDDAQFWASLGPVRRNAIAKFALPVRSAGSTLAGLQRLHAAPNLRSLHLVRHASVEYTDMLAWAVMRVQLVAEFQRMEQLEELKVFTPEAVDFSEQDVARK